MQTYIEALKRTLMAIIGPHKPLGTMEITTWDEQGENRILVALNIRDEVCRAKAAEFLETLLAQEQIEESRGGLKACPTFFRGSPPGFDARDPNDPAGYEAAKFGLLDEDGRLPAVSPLLNEIAAKLAREHQGLAYMGSSRPDSAPGSGMAPKERINVADKLPKTHPLPPSYMVIGEPTPTDRQVQHIRLDDGVVGQLEWDNNLLDPPKLSDSPDSPESSDSPDSPELEVDEGLTEGRCAGL